MTPPPISRQGLSRCPSCLAHVAVAADPRATVCPFCGGAFAAPAPTLSRAGSSALIAALGLSLAMTGCGTKSEPAPEAPRPPAERDTIEAPPPIQPAVYGGPPRDELLRSAPPPPADDTDTDAPEPLRRPDAPEQPVYGGAPRLGPPLPPKPPPKDRKSPPPADDGPKTSPPPPDAPPAAAYGGPPMDRVAPPAPVPVAPPQGGATPAPPAPDGGAKADPPEPGPIEVVPLYGVAPMEPRR
jgi:hypothetical protein